MSSKTNQYASFLKTHFVDLPKLFGHVKVAQRGELYHVLHMIAKEYHSNWDGTLSMNTYNDCRKLVNLFKIYNVKHNIPKIDKYERRRKFITNMFTTLRRTGDIAEKIDGTVEKVDSLINKLNSVVDTSHHDIKKIFSNISSFTDMFVPSGDSFVEIISYIVKFASFAYLLSQEQNRTPSNILALLVLILPTGVGDCVISSLSRAIQGIWTKFRAKDTMIANSNQDDGTIVAFFKVTLQLIQTLFTNISLEKFKNMQISVAKIKMIADYLKNSSTIFEYIMKLFQKCIEIAGNKILKYYGKLPKILQEETLNDLIDKYVEIKENQYDIKAKSNSYHAKMVVDVYNSALQAQAKMIKSSKRVDFGQSKLLAYLNIIVKNLEPIIQKIPDHVKGTKNARRTKPFWIYIFGEPRIGKTSMFQPYIVNAVSRACGLIEKYKDYSEYTYFRNCGDEYWEKYCGQPVLWYNDLFQVFTNEQKVNVGIEELTNVVDDNLYPLNMAFEEKHNVYFDSQLVISNAQKDIVGQTFVTNKCLSEGTHINARRNLVCRLRVDSKYKQCGGLNYDAMAEAKAKGVPHVGELFPKDMYLVDFMDPLSGSLIKTVYFEEAIMIIINCFKNYKEHQDKFKEKLFDHFEKMWQTNANDTFEDAHYDLNHPEVRVIYDTMCQHCEIAYQHTAMLNELERQEIKKTLMENCVHKVKETFSRWREFGAMVKENIKSFWQKTKEFCKSNWKYMILGFVPVIIGMVRGYFQDTWIATSSEGNIKAPKTRIVRTKNKEMFTNAYSQQNTDVEYKILKNMAFITLTHPEAGTTVKMGSVLGIGGDLFLIPRHFYVRFKEINDAYGDDKLVISLNFSGYQEVSMLFVDIKEIKVDFEHLADLAFIQFPKMICLSKIDKFFVTTKDEPLLYGAYLYGKRVHTPNTIHSIPVFNAFLTSREYDQPGMEIQSLGKYIPSRRVIIPEGYEFRLNGIGVGDCGMVLLNTDERMNARKIMAMHVAGTIDGNSGCAATIYHEDIVAAYEAAGIFIAMGDTEILPVSAVTSVLKTDLDGMFYNLGAPPTFNGKKVKLSVPMKTKISKSVFFDMLEEDLGPHQTIPAKLRPFEIDGVRVSPLLLGLKKLTRTIFPIQEDIRKHIYEHMSITIKGWYSLYLENPRLLTMEETLNGMKGLNKLDINTSPGYPFILQRNDVGKKQWFNIIDEKLVMTDELREICDYRENMAKQGIIVPAYFIDTLKDETRPIKKVLQGKTRVFQVGPMDLSILMRKYFGFFLAHCQNTYIEGEMGVGINPNSYDWTQLFKRLKRVSNKFINGDYENYDSSLIQIIMRNFSTIVEDFYGDAPPEDRLVREVLLATVVNNYHIVEDYVYRIDQGNMSGIVMTSIVNCLFNMFLIRYAYMLLVDGDLINFHRDVSCTFYGDDNLVAVSERIIDKLNMVTYKNVMASLGINYTTPDKTNEIPLFYNEDEVSYLKRKFVCKEGIYYAQLDMNVITEIPRWSESDPYNMTDQLNRFNCVLYESVNYGYDMYRKFYILFVKYIQQSTKFGFVMDARDLLTYHYILKSMFPQFFSSDLVKMFDKRNDLLIESGRNIPDKNMSNCEIDNGNSHSELSIATNENDKDNKEFETNSCEGNLTRPHTKVNRVMVTHGYCDRDLLDNIDFSINFSQEKWITNSNVEALQKMDENAAETVTRTQITTTFDDTIPHITSDGEIETPIEFNPFIDVTLDAFIKREWYLAEFDWTAAYTRTALATWIEPIQTLKDSLKCKVNNIAFWAPDIELTFRVNGTAMHYGRLMIIAIPSTDTLHDAYKQPLNASQHRFVQLSPTGNQTVVMKLPWMHQLDRIPVYNAVTNKTWTLYCWVAAPLQCANAAVASPVTVQVYARVSKPRFSGYTHMVTNSNDKMEQRTREQLILSETAVQARAPKQSGIVEFTNTIAKDVTTLAGDMSQLAGDIGFAVPASLKASVPVNVRSIQLHKAEDLPPSIIMGESQAAGVIKSDKQANAIKDGMHITKMAGRMVLLDTFKIAHDTAPGTKLMSYSLCPIKLFTTDYEITPETGTIFPSPASYISRLFKFWRGSFKFHFSIVSSAFHSMRLRMTYTPTVVNAYTTPTTSSAVLNINELWDINNQTDYSFTVPFHYWSEWASMDDSMGVLYVLTQTKLSSIVATTSIQPIYMQVWVGMDDDFQLAYPRILPYGTIVNGVKMYNPDVVPAPALFTLGDVQDVEPDGKAEKMITNSNNTLTMGNPLLNYKKDQFPAMSSDGLEKLHYPILGGYTKKHKNIRCTQAFEISSIKELINMFSPMDYTLVTVTDPLGVHVLRGKKYRYTGTLHGNYKDISWMNYFKQFKALFRYYRGGMRMGAVVRHYYNTGKVSAVGFTDTATIWDGAEWSDDDSDTLGFANMQYLTHGCHYFADSETQPIDVTIPYHSSTKTTLNTNTPVNPAYSFATSSPAGTLTVSVPQVPGESIGTSIAEINWFLAAADDGQFGYQLPVPRCRSAQ